MPLLLGEYSYRDLPREEFEALAGPHHATLFGDTLTFDNAAVLSEQERRKQEHLRLDDCDRFVMRIGIFLGDELVGWHISRQRNHEELYMINTGILPDHQGKGIYTALLPLILERAREQGFQIVTSTHNATNNQVIVPKLKAGFFIVGMEISDRWGTLVKLAYYFNPLRRQMMHVRSGQRIPNAEVRQYLPLDS